VSNDALAVVKELYSKYKDTGDRSIEYHYENAKDKVDTNNILSYLEERGYIRKITGTIGYIVVQLSVEGIAFAENGFSEPSSIPLVSGSNNILIQGSRNTVSDNFNTSVNIEKIDLPDAYKELLESFLKEMKDQTIPSEKKHSKIAQFLSDVSSGTLSGVTSSTLMILLQHLFGLSH
jgi:hypothetical protein